MKLFQLFFAAAGCAAAILAHHVSLGQDSTGAFPSFAQVRSVVEERFQSLPDFRSGDLITAGDVAPIFRTLETLGWSDVSRSEFARRLVEDQEFLARELRSTPGRAFMRRVSSYRLIYDRLDRIARMTGGQQLVHDMIRLPDGHRYAQAKPPRGVPPMTDFLPKGASGKAPRVADIDKPTGRIYTLDDFLTQLEAAHRKAQRNLDNQAGE